MRITISHAFLKDVEDLPKPVRRRIDQIVTLVQLAPSPREISNLKALEGHGGAYSRIRVGDYRIGVSIDGDHLWFIRCLHRRDIYRRFP